MNTIWSTYVQGIDTLYLSRRLRFSDRFRAQYQSAFSIDGGSHILEIGCGPGALAQSLHRWYPGAQVSGIDRDRSFIEFARKNVPASRFQRATPPRRRLKIVPSMSPSPTPSQSTLSPPNFTASSAGS